jgi:hypothetical protein
LVALASSPPLAAGKWQTIDIAAIGDVGDVVATPGGGFLALGSADSNGAAWLSDDGLTWRAVADVPPVGEQEARGFGALLPAEGGGYLAFGGQGGRYSEPYQSLVWASDDGTSWRRAAVIPGFVLDEVLGGPGFIAVGADPGLDNLNGARAWSSTDGTTWTDAPAVPGPDLSAMTSLTPFRGGWVAVGASRDGLSGAIQGLAWSTSDGASWKLLSMGSTLAEVGLSQVVADGEELVATGSFTISDPRWGEVSRPAVVVSADGSDWAIAFERDCCGEFRSLIARPGGVLGMYRWYDPESGSDDMVLVRTTSAEAWETIGRPQLDAGITLDRLAVVGGDVWGLGHRELPNFEAPVILLPPYPL